MRIALPRVPLAVLASLLASQLLHAQTPEPVPASMLQGTRLAVGEGVATIESPAAFWKWLRYKAPEGQFFLCRNSMNENDFPYLLLVAPPTSKAPLTSADMDLFMHGVRTGIRRSVGRDVPIARPSFEPSSIPFAGAYRYRCEVLLPQATAYAYGYAVQKGQLYSTLCVVFSSSEPSGFTRFSESLRVLASPSAPRSRTKPILAVVAAAVLLWLWRRRSAS
jgi:hypothetical protein